MNEKLASIQEQNTENFYFSNRYQTSTTPSTLPINFYTDIDTYVFSYISIPEKQNRDIFIVDVDINSRGSIVALTSKDCVVNWDKMW